MNDQYEIEVFGVNYERFALGNLIKKLYIELDINTVAELPALGTKAMPSIYSLGFGLGKKQVTLINGIENFKKEWQKLNIDQYMTMANQLDIYHTIFDDNTFDFVWNFAYMPSEKNPDLLIKEMIRISKKYIAIFSVNAGNVGYHIHSMLHRINKIPWTHGDRRYNNRHFVEEQLKLHGIHIVKKGFVDCPIWPDSLGFRDMRLHRENISFDNTQWISPYTDMLKDNKFPKWMNGIYLWESIPMVPVIKTIYSHLFYIIGEKREV